MLHCRDKRRVNQPLSPPLWETEEGNKVKQFFNFSWKVTIQVSYFPKSGEKGLNFRTQSSRSSM